MCVPDRAALLTTQDPSSIIRLQMKLAGLPSNSNIEKFEESFIKQAEEFKDFEVSSINKVMKVEEGHYFSKQKIMGFG